MNKQFEFYRNFGTISNDSIITDLYKKRISTKKKKQMGKPKANRCITRIATEEEKEKYLMK